jgi:hypothetical protein
MITVVAIGIAAFEAGILMTFLVQKILETDDGR